MNILVLNGSPKKRGGASRYFSNVLKLMLTGHSIMEYSLRNSQDYDSIFKSMETADAVALSVPLYVDGIPSHVLRFLKEAELFCKDNPCRFKLYVISNGGFIEGCQSKPHLEQYRLWCEKTGAVWGGGLGIGGGVMMHVLSYVMLVYIGMFLAQMILNLIAGVPMLSGVMFVSLGQNVLVLLLFSIGMLVCLWILSRAIRHGKGIKNLYTRVMLPSFLFLIVTDIFMLLSALLKGKLIFSLYKKDL